MIREIIQAPDPRLHQPSAPIRLHLDALGELVGDLIDTRVHHKAAGISAVQIGHHVRVVAVDPMRFFGFTLIVNPEIVERGRELVTDREGCMSIGHGKLRFMIRRHQVVTAKFLDRKGHERTAVCKGFAARLIQHECDHLEGVMIA